MKRIDLSLAIAIGLVGMSLPAEEPARLSPAIHPPAASLGAPRPGGLGTPRPAPKTAQETTTVGYSPISASMPSPEPLTPLLPVQKELKIDAQEEIKKLPTPEIKESESPAKELPAPKLTPQTPAVISRPINSSPVVPAPVISQPVITYPALGMAAPQCDTPGCALPMASRPFTSGGNNGYASVEYLMWWMKSYSIPVLATTGPDGSDGILGQPGVVPVLGGGNSDPTGRSGARINLGWWLGSCRNYALDLNFFFLGDRGSDSAVNSSAFPLLARPFTVPNMLANPNDPRLRLNIPGQFSELTAAPRLQSGGVGFHTDSLFWGGDIALRRKWLDNGISRVDVLAGYRHLDLKENLEITETFVGLPGGPNAGNAGVLFDQFRTGNNFNGALVGLLFDRQRGRWNFGINTRLGFGVTTQTLDIAGGQAQFGPGARMPTTPGGLLALNSNIGHYAKNRLSFVPEIGVTLGYDVTERLQLTMSYNMIYWSNVLRPGDQVDTTLDLTRVPILNDPTVFPQAANVAPTRVFRPAATLRDSDLWVQGLSWGLKYVW